MKVLQVSALVIVSGLAFAPMSYAADLPAYPLSMPKPPQYIQEFVSSWYLRFDAGYRLNNVSGGSAFDGTPFADSTMSNSLAVGGGFGFKARWLRGDITFDYGLQPHFAGTTIPGTIDVSAKIENVTVLANGYFDLGTWFGLTPYVGAGVGTSFVKPTEVSALLLPLNQPVDSNGEWRFSWAAMGGVSFSISPNILIDTSYRYLDLGTPHSTFPGAQMTYGNLTAQEVRIGLRYMIE